MKTTRTLLLAGIMAALCCSIGNAQIIYSNTFSGSASVNLWNTQPTVANTFAGGSSAAVWKDALGSNDTGSYGADGSIPNEPNSLTLPFTPQSGFLYTLTATLTFTANPGNWVGLGFAERNSENVPSGYGRFSDSGNGGPAGINWLIGGAGRGEQWFEGPKANPSAGLASGSVMPNAGTYTWQLTLNTSPSQWVIACYINGTQFGSDFTYPLVSGNPANPTIGAVGITENSSINVSNIQWNDLVLTAAPVPEPSVSALIGAGLTMLFLVTLCLKRRRDAAGESFLQ